jgi:transcriptional regulator with XRE-family HTH domain
MSVRNILMPMKLIEWKKLNRDKMSIRQLAESVGVHESLLSLYLSGKRGLSKETALKVAEATGWQVSVLELLYPDRDFVFTGARVVAVDRGVELTVPEMGTLGKG